MTRNPHLLIRRRFFNIIIITQSFLTTATTNTTSRCCCCSNNNNNQSREEFKEHLLKTTKIMHDDEWKTKCVSCLINFLWLFLSLSFSLRGAKQICLNDDMVIVEKKPFNDFYSMLNKFAKTHKEKCLCWLEIIIFLATQNKAKKLAMKRLFLSPTLMTLRAIKRSIYLCSYII